MSKGFLYCDNRRELDCLSISLVLDTEHATYERARARGWHIWHGITMGGEEKTVVLCNKCAGNKPIEKPLVMEGDQQLF